MAHAKKRIFLLDRNILSGIREAYRNGISKKTMETVNLARSIDHVGVSISALTSIAEATGKGPIRKVEFYENLRKDNRTIKGFYYNAKTDASITSRLKSKFYDAVADEVYSDLTSLTNLITYLQFDAGLHNPRNTAQAIALQLEAQKRFGPHNSPKSNLIKIIATSAIFGNEGARKVIKPRKIQADINRSEAAYNAIMDANAIRTITFLTAQFQGIRVELLTMDLGLRKFAKDLTDAIGASSTSPSVEDVTHTHALDITDGLFPLAKSREDKDFVESSLKNWS